MSRNYRRVKFVDLSMSSLCVFSDECSTFLDMMNDVGLTKSSNFIILGDPGEVSREKRRDESFQAQAEEPLGTDSHRTISKRSKECWFLIGHRKCFVLLCPIGEQFLVSCFREFVHDGYYVATVARFVHQA